MDEEFVGEVGEQRVHFGSFSSVKVFTILGTQKMLVQEMSFAPLTTLSGSSEGINLLEPCEA